MKLPRPLWLGAVALALLATAALAVKPLARARLEHRLDQRIGPVASLSIGGSPLQLLRGRAEEIDVRFRSAQLGGGGKGLGGGVLERVDDLDLRADALEAKGVRMESAHVTKHQEAVRARATLPAQDVTFGSRTLAVTPESEGGELILRVGEKRRVRVFAEAGTLRVGLAGGGLLGGLSRPVPIDGLAVDSVGASDDGVVDLRGRIV
jgi:hypothetical protein